MDKILIGIAVIWGGLWLLGQILGWLARVSTEFGHFWERTRPGRERATRLISDPLSRFRAALTDYRLIDRFLVVFVVACILLLALDGPWLVRTLDGFGGRRFPFAGWALFGAVIGIAMSATSRILELGWIGSATSVARVPDIAHLRSGDAESAVSFRVRRVAGLLAFLFLLFALGAGYWRNADYLPAADPDGKAALSAAVSGGNMTVLNGALSGAAVLLDSEPGKALGILLAVSQATKDAVRPEVAKIAADAGRYLQSYREETEKSVTDGKPDALARSEAFAQLDNTTSLNWLGRLFETGKGGAKRDLVKAFSSYEAAAALGDKKTAVGQENLARVMAAQKDEAVRQAAFAYLEKRAQGDTPAAWYWLGEWYRNSTQTGDSKKSETWLGKAMDQESDSAVKDQAFKALLKIVEPSPIATKVLDEHAPKYVKGKNPELKKIAYDYLERRASAGDPGAMMWMAYRFREGDSVAKDPVKAHDWLLKAALQNKSEKVKNLAFEALGETNHPPIAGTGGQRQAAENQVRAIDPPVAVAAPPAPDLSVIRNAPPTRPVEPTPAPVAREKAIGMPLHSHLNVYGNGWVCDSGYRQSGNECVAVQIPPNAQLNVYGNGWVCSNGYRQSGSECVRVQIPPNAQLNVYGNGWVCSNGFRQSGSECVPVQIPQNAQLNVYGNGWVCSNGYRQSGNECLAVQIPPYARLNVYGNGWVCNSGFRQNGNECFSLQGR